MLMSKHFFGSVVRAFSYVVHCEPIFSSYNFLKMFKVLSVDFGLIFLISSIFESALSKVTQILIFVLEILSNS